jgi:hypothetical protein
MDDRFLQQLKKGVLEMLVLDTVCKGSTYGYELLTALKTRSNDLFALKEGTLYPILYRLEDDGLIEAICDMMIGSAELIKSGVGTPSQMAKAVASKGGTTEQALKVFDEREFDKIIADAMVACTRRADELGNKK